LGVNTTNLWCRTYYVSIKRRILYAENKDTMRKNKQTKNVNPKTHQNFLKNKNTDAFIRPETLLYAVIRMKTMKIEVPIETELMEIEVYRKTFKGYFRDYEVHYVFKDWYFWIMTEKEAKKILKARQEVRERMLDKLIHEVSEYPLVFKEVSYQSYPIEGIEKYEVIVPVEIVTKMKERGLVLVAINTYSAYDGKEIRIFVFKPEEIEASWGKTTIAIDELPQI